MIEIYKAPEGDTQINVTFEKDTVWLNQQQMALLFGKGRSTITEHIQNIFKEKELDEELVCRNFRHTTQHGAIVGKTQEAQTRFCNLDVIISVGYRVKSLQETLFRQWGTRRLKDYLIQGYAINEKRLAEREQRIELSVF